MPRRRLLIAFGVFTILVAVALAVFILTRTRLNIDAATAARISQGMTEAEVDAVIGGPEGSYGRGFLLGRTEFDVGKVIVGAAKRKRWSGDLGIILVWFDGGGRVMLAEFLPNPF